MRTVYVLQSGDDIGIKNFTRMLLNSVMSTNFLKRTWENTQRASVYVCNTCDNF